MISPDSLIQLQAVFGEAQTCLVVLGSGANYDQTASALALYKAVKGAGKDVAIISPEENQYQSLGGVDQIKQKLGNKDLSISFDYDESQVDKVSYHIDEQKKKFYLVIKPKKGNRPLDTSQVSFDYVGAEADLVFLVGVHNFQNLEHLYEGYENVYDTATVVTVHNFEPEIGDITLNISGGSCWAESLVSVIEGLGLSLDADAATNLLSSIEESTKNLSSFTATAETFEVVAKLMRLGGKRNSKKIELVEKTPSKISEESIELQPEGKVVKPQVSPKPKKVSHKLGQDKSTKIDLPQSSQGKKKSKKSKKPVAPKEMMMEGRVGRG